MLPGFQEAESGIELDGTWKSGGIGN